MAKIKSKKKKAAKKDVEAQESGDPKTKEAAVEVVEEVVEPLVVLATPEQTKEIASSESWDLAGTPKPEKVEAPAEAIKSTQVWKYRKGDDCGEQSIRIAAIRQTQAHGLNVAVGDGEMYEIEFKMEADNRFPVASIPAHVANTLRSMSSFNRNYREL